MSETLHNASSARLRALVGRIERLDGEIDELNEDKAAVYKEAKSDGFDLPVLRKLIAGRRKMSKNPDRFEEECEILQMYQAAMGSGTIPATRALTRQTVSETPHDPITGEVSEPVMTASETEKAEAAKRMPVRYAGETEATVFTAPERPAPYRIVRDAPKPPVEDLDLPAGLRREPVARSAAE